MNDWISNYGMVLWAITLESAPWVVVSLVFGGLIREFLPSTRFQRLVNRPGLAGMGGAVTVGALLPICSCGVVPLAISLFRAGVRIGPVMAFTAATPIINPAAVILSFGLLGPQITAAYIALGLLLPFLLGMAAERWTPSRQTDLAAETAVNLDPAPISAGLGTRVARGLRWGLGELGPSVGFYLAIGILLAGVVMVLAPTHWLQQYLGSASWVSLLAAGVLGAIIYVCAVAHIPLVATLLAAGAAPGAAVVFLVTGTATNLPELIALYKTIGKRVVILYAGMLIALSFVAGLLINAWLLPGYKPVFDPIRGLDMLERSAGLSVPGSGALTLASAGLITVLALWGLWRHLRGWLLPARPRVDAGCSCCQHDQTAP
jgi:uncharacterized membrane protein YraQ (UPF0718 family)